MPNVPAKVGGVMQFKVTRLILLFWNAELPMVVTELGMLISVSPEQPSNASLQIEVTFSPIVIDVIFLYWLLLANMFFKTIFSQLILTVFTLQLEYLQLVVFQYILIKTVEK